MTAMVGRVAVVAGLVAGSVGSIGAAEAATLAGKPITKRHVDLEEGRAAATEHPQQENDQAVVDGWPLYRTERGQEAFNHAMATLKATDEPAPTAAEFDGCDRLDCRLKLPRMTKKGWIPAGRLWVSPKEYVLVVHSPRRNAYDPGRRRSFRSMRYFVFHEFHNSTGNTDVFDTISAHRGSVFVPFYLGKPGRDAKGRRYVVVVQVAPYDVMSRHARVYGSRGPGIEVAKNRADPLGKLQATAGVLVAAIVKRAAPHLRMVNHRGSEGWLMLRTYQRHASAWKRAAKRPAFQVPFVPAAADAVATARGRLSDMIVHAGAPTKTPAEQDKPVLLAGVPQLVSAPRLVHILREPVMTMEKLISRFAFVPVAPKPQSRP